MSKSAGNEYIRKLTDAELIAAKDARSKLTKSDVTYFGKTPHTTGMLIMNYANMITNRIIDKFDDVIFLVEAERLSSACSISRCVLETYAVGLLALDKLQKLMQKDDLEGAGLAILRFINSSKFKVNEQKAFKDGKYRIEDFHFTDEARARLITEGAVSIHVLDAMRLLFDLDKSYRQSSQSAIELTYDALCEATHPSQTSLLHYYAVNMPSTETSFGAVSVKEAQIYSCVMGIHHIRRVSIVRDSLYEVGEAFHNLENQQRS